MTKENGINQGTVQATSQAAGTKSTQDGSDE